jgi:hypothetical protein
VRRYDKLPCHGEPHKLRGSMKALQEYVEPRAGKDRVYISLYDDEIMSIYPGAFQIYTTRRSCTYGNYFSWKSVTISETKIKAPTPGTHMHPTAIRSLIPRPTTTPFEFVHSGSGTTYEFWPPHAHFKMASPSKRYGQILCKDDIFTKTQRVRGRSSQTLERMR